MLSIRQALAFITELAYLSWQARAIGETICTYLEPFVFVKHFLDSCGCFVQVHNALGELNKSFCSWVLLDPGSECDKDLAALIDDIADLNM